MDVLYLLLPISGVFAVIIVLALVWAVKSGQFDDLEGPAHRILMDDDENPVTKPKTPPQADTEKASDEDKTSH
ncbi:MAG TPA: cbb3-type cytochrome oxidase assembly protein CcoS [Gammaproteobacteria bacterium]|nr:cbb3-type cytochrome oxidase assembly protein CcoS [Gammaproteobacteria bacterium]